MLAFCCHGSIRSGPTRNLTRRSWQRHQQRWNLLSERPDARWAWKDVFLRSRVSTKKFRLISLHTGKRTTTVTSGTSMRMPCLSVSRHYKERNGDCSLYLFWYKMCYLVCYVKVSLFTHTFLKMCWFNLTDQIVLHYSSLLLPPYWYYLPSYFSWKWNQNCLHICLHHPTPTLPA